MDPKTHVQTAIEHMQAAIAAFALANDALPKSVEIEGTNEAGAPKGDVQTVAAAVIGKLSFSAGVDADASLNVRYPDQVTLRFPASVASREGGIDQFAGDLQAALDQFECPAIGGKLGPIAHVGGTWLYVNVPAACAEAAASGLPEDVEVATSLSTTRTRTFLSGSERTAQAALAQAKTLLRRLG